MGCFDNLRLPWMRANDLGEAGPGDHLAENFRMIDQWANRLEDHCTSGSALVACTFASSTGIDMDAAGVGAGDECFFPSSAMDAGGNSLNATEGWATSGVTILADGGMAFDGDDNGMFLQSFSARYGYQDTVARTETCLETQMGLDNVFPTGPPMMHAAVDVEQFYFTHTGITFGTPTTIQIRNLSVADCYLINPQLTIVQLVPNDSSFTQVIP